MNPKSIVMAAMACVVAANVSAQKNKTLNEVIDSIEWLPIESLSEVFITGNRTNASIGYGTTTTTVIGRKQIEENNEVSLLPLVTEQTPGMFTTTRGMFGYGVSTNAAGAMKIRGVGGGGDMLVVIDGQPHFAGLQGHPIPDAYQSMMAEKVEVLRGPASTFYGSNAMGGVLNIITRKPDRPVTNVSVQGGSYGTLLAEGSNAYSNNRFSSFVGVNYGRTDGHRDNSGFEQSSLYSKLGYEDEWTVTWDVNLTHFTFDNPGPESAPLLDATAKITRGTTSLYVGNDYSPFFPSIRVFYDWGHHNINDGHVATASPRKYLYKHDDFTFGVSAYKSERLGNNSIISLGIDWRRYGGEAWNDSLVGGNKYYDKIKNQEELAGYINFNQRICKSLVFIAGLRVNHHSEVGTELVPQASLTWDMTDKTNIKALVSKGFRNPLVSEMYMFAANEDLEPERMMNYELSFSHRFTRGMLSANVFYIDGDNMIERAANPNGAGMLQQNLGAFHNWGFELNGDYSFNRHFSMNANYSFLHMNKPVTGAPEHKAFVQGRYSVGIMSFIADIQYINSLYIKTGKTEEVEKYLLLNFSATAKVTSNVSFFVKGDNLLAQRYQAYDGFWMPRATFMSGVKVRL